MKTIISPIRPSDRAEAGANLQQALSALNFSISNDERSTAFFGDTTSLKHELTHEIFYRDIFKMHYYELNDRVRQMANVLKNLKINGGQTIGFMDYDSYRFLEGL